MNHDYRNFPANSDKSLLMMSERIIEVVSLMSMQNDSEKDDFENMMVALEIDPQSHDDMLLVIAGRFATQCVLHAVRPLNEAVGSSVTASDIVLDYVRQNYETLDRTRQKIAEEERGEKNGS